MTHVVVRQEELLEFLLPSPFQPQLQILEDDEEDLHWALAVVDRCPVLDDAAPTYDLLDSP